MNKDVIAAVRWLDEQPNVTIYITDMKSGPRVRIFDNRNKKELATAQTLPESLSNINERVKG